MQLLHYTNQQASIDPWPQFRLCSFVPSDPLLAKVVTPDPLLTGINLPLFGEPGYPDKGRSLSIYHAHWKMEECHNAYWDGLTALFVKLVEADSSLLEDAYIKKWYKLSK